MVTIIILLNVMFTKTFILHNVTYYQLEYITEMIYTNQHFHGIFQKKNVSDMSDCHSYRHVN